MRRRRRNEWLAAAPALRHSSAEVSPVSTTSRLGMLGVLGKKKWQSIKELGLDVKPAADEIGKAMEHKSSRDLCDYGIPGLEV